MGLLGHMVAGAAQGAGNAAAKIGFTQIEANIREEQAKRLAEFTSTLQEGVQTRAEDRGMVNRAAERATIFGETLERAPQMADLEVDKAKKLAAAKLETDFAELQKLGPERIRQAVQQQTETLKAMSTPEMLKHARLQAQAKHIVDPAYAPLKLADGTVVMVDARSGKTTGTLKGADGAELVIRDGAEQSAAVASLQYANNALRIAETKYKTDLNSVKDVTTDPKVKEQTVALAEAEWRQAQASSHALAASALAVLQRNMKAPPVKPKAGLIDAPETYPGGGNAAPAVRTFDPATGKFN
jgi:hypothetical protein